MLIICSVANLHTINYQVAARKLQKRTDTTNNKIEEDEGAFCSLFCWIVKRAAYNPTQLFAIKKLQNIFAIKILQGYPNEYLKAGEEMRETIEELKERVKWFEENL